MPKPPTFPTLFDHALQISTTKLKEWGYLLPGQVIKGTISWSKNGSCLGSVYFLANTIDDSPYIELDYTFKGNPRKYKVWLVTVPSNLGKGVIWYFQCPHTNKRCRKLYSIGGYFLHRDAFQGCMYECQTASKHQRDLKKILGIYFQVEDLYAELISKNFKHMYAGKPTKRYRIIAAKINKAKGIHLGDFVKYMDKSH